MRISDWSSDVCSSDLRKARVVEEVATFHEHREAPEQRLVGRRDVDVLAVARLVEVVRRMARQPRARALGHGAEPFVGRHRSEAHKSELKSLMRTSYAVFCLKKTNTNYTIHI